MHAGLCDLPQLATPGMCTLQGESFGFLERRCNPMTRRERTPERLKDGGDVAAAWILVAALLLMLATLSAFELSLPDMFSRLLGRE